MSLLPLRTRAAYGLSMSLTDWIRHGFWLLVDPRYRRSVYAIKAMQLPPDWEPEDRNHMDKLPMCVCGEFYEDHPPDCPVRRRIEELENKLLSLVVTHHL